jgi:homogentisate 1,2-dioxygenase
MPFYRRIGSVPHKRHTMHRVSPGYKDEGIYYEEVVTTQGFSRAYSIVYHLRPPTRVVDVEAAGHIHLNIVKDLPLRHVHTKTGAIPTKRDPITGRIPIYANTDVVVSRCRPATDQIELFRNASADEIIFLHRGRGRLLTMFGAMPIRPFDYVVIP